MSSGMHAETASLEQLLGGQPFYRVPSYQRPYSWTTREAGQLLDDVLLAMAEDGGERGSDAGYFLGAMLLIADPARSAGPETGPAWRDIVDGQQRLVTLTILVCVLRDLFIDLDHPMADRLHPLIMAKPDDMSEPRPRVELQASEQAFLERFVLPVESSSIMPEDDDLPPAEQRLLSVREHLMSELVGRSPEQLIEFTDYLLGNCFVAIVTAKCIDRAHRIFTALNGRGRPLARNDILKAQILGKVTPEHRARRTTQWDAVEKRLGGRFDELFSHLRTILGRPRGRIISGVGALVEASGGPEPFLDDVLVPMADILSAIEERRSGSADVDQRLRYLGWLGSADWVPPAMLYWHLCGGDPGRLQAFFPRLERLAYALRLLGIGADKRLARFNAVLAAVRAGTADAPDGPLELSRDELRNIAWNLRSLHARSQLTCKLLLMRLSDELAGAPQGLEPSDYTVEHVLPQRPGRISEWRVWFPAPEQRESLGQSIGNLVLVTREQNDRARNLELSKKLAIYFAPGGGPVPHITRDLEGVTSWRPEDVTAREERLLEAVARIWQISIARPAATKDQPAPPRLRPRRRAAGPDPR
jgi:hypothetical protein